MIKYRNKLIRDAISAQKCTITNIKFTREIRKCEHCFARALCFSIDPDKSNIKLPNTTMMDENTQRYFKNWFDAISFENSFELITKSKRRSEELPYDIDYNSPWDYKSHKILESVVEIEFEIKKMEAGNINESERVSLIMITNKQSIKYQAACVSKKPFLKGSTKYYTLIFSLKKIEFDTLSKHEKDLHNVQWRVVAYSNNVAFKLGVEYLYNFA